MYVFQRAHPMQHKIYEEDTSAQGSKSVPTSDGTASFIIQGLKKPNVNPIDLYPAKHSVQQNFEKALLEFFVLDCVHLDLVSRLGFRRLLYHLNPKLQIPHRRTLNRRLDALHKQV